MGRRRPRNVPDNPLQFGPYANSSSLAGATSLSTSGGGNDRQVADWDSAPNLRESLTHGSGNLPRADQLLELDRLGLRCDAQFFAQSFHAAGVLANRSAAVARLREGTHETPVAPLAGAVELERERGIRYRRFVSLPRIVVIGQIVEDREEHPPKPLTVVSAPLGHPTFEQISSVEPGGLRERSCLFRSEIFTPATIDCGECLLELNDIDVYTVVERKLEPFGLSMQQLGGPGPAERNQPGVELPKRLAEVFPRIGRVLFAPEELG